MLVDFLKYDVLLCKYDIKEFKATKTCISLLSGYVAKTSKPMA